MRSLNTIGFFKHFLVVAEILTNGGLVGLNDVAVVLFSLSCVFPVAAREEHVGGLLLRLNDFGGNIRWNCHVPFVGKLLFEVIRDGIMLLGSLTGHVLLGLRILIFIIRIVGLLNRLIVFLDGFITIGGLEILETTLEKIFLSKITSSRVESKTKIFVDVVLGMYSKSSIGEFR